ncbi:hypothetical protein JTB14_024481 [Gonioctena quinquepunctata]|nr:hypothetical protein JTB14_024481 [Gonioctena quinquepunctata]
MRHKQRSRLMPTPLNLMHIRSDPVITSKRKFKKRRHEKNPVEALQLLKVSSPFDSSSEEEEEEKTDDDADSDF